MYLIVGLGNPGSEYDRTRHNMGFLVADALAGSGGAIFKPGRGEYWSAVYSYGNADIAILKPITYMNNSGIAVQEFLGQNDVPLENLLVVCDDFQLPIGSVRLRLSGSDGGHHGLSSVIYHLHTDQFARLRCGIGSVNMPSDKSRMKEFVLERFSESELPEVEQMTKQALSICETFISGGISKSMNRSDPALKEDIS
jgi:peptidyl-tRNA hydrolase, PTH1 family